MDTLDLLRSLAIIIIFAKLFGLIARKLRAPQVAGEIVAGLLIGPSLLNWVQDTDLIKGLAEIGVIMLMFGAGLETDLKQMKKVGLKATLVACCGVIAPLILGTLLYMAFYGWSGFGTDHFYHAIFIGTIMTAISVSITVQTLKEMGRLSGTVGQTIVGAAIIDDVIGILVLTFVIGLKDPSENLGTVALRTVLFFVFSAVVGFLCLKIFQWMDRRYPHTRRIPIFGLALCFGLAYIAEKYFGVADITGAYVAGIILCTLGDSDYIARKMDINSYMVFGPVFFASIGLQTNVRSLDMNVLWFSLAFVVVAMAGKVIGCGAVSKAMGFTGKDSLKIGAGMMARGEVALIVSQKGLQVGMLESEYFTSVILLIIISSILTPVILKALYEKEDEADYTDFRHPVPAGKGALLKK